MVEHRPQGRRRGDVVVGDVAVQLEQPARRRRRATAEHVIGGRGQTEPILVGVLSSPHRASFRRSFTSSGVSGSRDSPRAALALDRVRPHERLTGGSKSWATYARRTEQLPGQRGQRLLMRPQVTPSVHTPRITEIELQ